MVYEDLVGFYRVDYLEAEQLIYIESQRYVHEEMKYIVTLRYVDGHTTTNVVRDTTGWQEIKLDPEEGLIAWALAKMQQ